MPWIKPTRLKKIIFRMITLWGVGLGEIYAQTLDQIIRQALAYHPGIKADKESLSASDDVVEQAVAGYMPTVDIRASIGRESIRRNFQATQLSVISNIGKISNTQTDPSFTIRQLLFDGMGRASRVARSRYQYHQMREKLGVTTDNVMLDAASAALDIRRLQRLLRITERNIHFHETIRNTVAEIVEAGAAPISDLYQVEARLQDTIVSKASIQSDLDAAYAKYKEAVGVFPPAYMKRTCLPGYLTPKSMEMAIRMARDNNNTIKVAKSNLKIAETNYRETDSKFVPTITFEMEGELDRNPSGSRGTQSRITTLLVARQNIFSGGADMARAREMIKRVTEAKARIDLAIRQTERTIRAAWSEIKNAINKSIHLSKLIQEKRKIRDTYLIEFTVGKRTIIDILDAANDVFLTEATRTTADSAFDINIVILSIGTGQFMNYVKKAAPVSAPCDTKNNAIEATLVSDSKTLEFSDTREEKPLYFLSDAPDTEQEGPPSMEVKELEPAKNVPVKSTPNKAEGIMIEDPASVEPEVSCIPSEKVQEAPKKKVKKKILKKKTPQKKKKMSVKPTPPSPQAPPVPARENSFFQKRKERRSLGD
jgi:adhesin transport system outer membrane protein